MKRTLIALLFAGCLCAAKARAQNNKTEPQATTNGVGWVKVEYPNGGDSLVAGSTIKIKWSASKNLGKFLIGYTFGDGKLKWIDFDVPIAGTHEWTVNLNGHEVPAGAKIEITGYDGAGGVTDQSDSYFTIYPAKKGKRK